MSTCQREQGKVGLLAAAIIGMNAMVGVGIVTIPAMLSQKVGPAGILSYVLCILIVIALGIALGRVAHRYPGEGWTYLYPAQWAGHKVGLAAAVSYLVGVLVAMGFLIQQAGIWAHQLLPFISPKVLGLSIIFILMILVMAGAEASSIGQYIIAACVVIPLLITALICWLHFNPELLKPFMPYGPISVFTAAPKALFAFLGFECIVSLYSVVKNPSKNVPRAFLIAILFVGALYVLFAGGLLAAIPTKLFAGGLNTTLSNILGKAFPDYPFLSLAVLIGAMFAIIGTLHSMLWSAAALFTDTLKRTKSKFIQKMLKKCIWNDRVSVVVSTVVMVFSALFFRAEALVDLTDLLLVFPSILSISALFFIPEEWKRGRNIVTIIALAGGLVMIYFAGEGFIEALSSIF